MIVYLGVDWAASAAETSVAFGMDRPCRFKKLARGAKQVRDAIADLASRSEVIEVRVIIESGAPGWVELFHEAGARVFVVDAAQSKAFAASLRSSGAKCDGSDADMMVLMGQSPVHAEREWKPRSAIVEAQDHLVRAHVSAGNRQCQAQQRLRALLREHLLPVEVGLKNLDRKWVWRLLHAAPTSFHAAKLSRSEFDALMDGTGIQRTTRNRMWDCLTAAAARPVDETLAKGLAARVRAMVDDIEHYADQKAEIESELDALTAGLELRQTLESIDGIGKTLSQHLMAVGFDIEAAPRDRDDVAIRMGAAPVFVGTGDKKNGKGKKGYVKMRRSASSLARRTTYLLGRLASQNLAWAKAQYAHARSRGKNAATAYRIVARSLLRILSAIIRNNEPYDEERYIRRLIAQGVPWAADLLPVRPEPA